MEDYIFLINIFFLNQFKNKQNWLISINTPHGFKVLQDNPSIISFCCFNSEKFQQKRKEKK